MTNTKYQKNVINTFICKALFVFASMILIITIFSVGNHIYFKNNAVATEGVIVNITETITRNSKGRDRIQHHVEVEYSVDEIEYKDYLGYYSNDMTEGDTITVYYDAKNPFMLLRKSNSSAPFAVPLVITLVFAGCASVFLIKELTAEKYINELIERNCFVYCDKWTEENTLSINNVRFKIAVFDYSDERGFHYVFKSNPYRHSNCPFTEGQQYRIYVDMSDPSKHYVSPDL